MTFEQALAEIRDRMANGNPHEREDCNWIAAIAEEVHRQRQATLAADSPEEKSHDI